VAKADESDAADLDRTNEYEYLGVVQKKMV
jgi:hypothetical protein